MAFVRGARRGDCLRQYLIAIAGCIGLGCIAAGAAPDTESTAYKMARHDPLSAAAQVGQQMFFDKGLSASGKLSCASCHDPDHAYAPANALSVQAGGKTLSQSGTRAVPSLRYKQVVPPYADLLDNPDGVSSPGPGGGFTQDGRAPGLAEQAKIPLLAANEMANVDGADVVAKIRRSSYARLLPGRSAVTSSRAPRWRFSVPPKRCRHSSSRTTASIPSAASTICFPATRSAAP
jgi:cytochrome c peroxidase